MTVFILEAMRSLQKIRATITDLRDRAFRDHGVELRNEAIKEYLNYMAQEKASGLIEESFKNYSLSDLMRTVDVLSESDFPEEKIPKGRAN